MKLFVGVKALITRHDGKVLVVREATHYIDGEGCCPGEWDVVGGRIQPEETLLEGLQREIMEESGMRVRVGTIVGVAENFPTMKGEVVHIIRVFYACSTEESEVKLSSDHDAYEWISPTEQTDLPLMENVAEMFKNYSKNL